MHFWEASACGTKRAMINRPSREPRTHTEAHSEERNDDDCDKTDVNRAPNLEGARDAPLTNPGFAPAAALCRRPTARRAVDGRGSWNLPRLFEESDHRRDPQACIAARSRVRS